MIFYLYLMANQKSETLIQKVSSSTNISNLKKYFPLNPEEIVEKEKNRKKYDELLFLLKKQEEKRLKTNENLINLFRVNQKDIENCQYILSLMEN